MSIATPLGSGGGVTVELPPGTTVDIGSEVEIKNDTGNPVPTAALAADAGLVALRDALRGTGNKTLADIVSALAGIATAANQATANATLATIAAGIPVTGNVEVTNDVGNALPASIANGADIALGSTTDAAATGNGSLVAIAKQLRVLLAGGLPAALAANGGVKVEGVAGGVAQPVDGSAARRGTLTDRSGTITTGGTAQNAIGVNASRNYLLIRNPVTATEDLWVSLVGTATAASPSIRLTPADFLIFECGFIATNAASVIAATTGHAFTCWEG